MRPGSPREQPPRDDYRPPAQFLVHVAAMCAAVPPLNWEPAPGLLALQDGLKSRHAQWIVLKENIFMVSYSCQNWH